ncbi:MAG TPA: hypothetical protein DDZ80_26560 [Cyanobacteria bacterium UBA8803]|nr:hypothetical protein [Cyanobacteria bacterium UBA9273]HBL61843.1 hypothetical protein [Cyanobacteria bacterium UBA8803]
MGNGEWKDTTLNPEESPFLNQVETWITERQNFERSTTELVETSMKDARIIEAQDVEMGEDGSPKLRRGVAPNRRIAIKDYRSAKLYPCNLSFSSFC